MVETVGSNSTLSHFGLCQLCSVLRLHFVRPEEASRAYAVPLAESNSRAEDDDLETDSGRLDC